MWRCLLQKFWQYFHSYQSQERLTKGPLFSTLEHPFGTLFRCFKEPFLHFATGGHLVFYFVTFCNTRCYKLNNISDCYSFLILHLPDTRPTDAAMFGQGQYR